MPGLPTSPPRRAPDPNPPRAWPVGIAVCVLVLLPTLYLAGLTGAGVITRRLTGDAYHFLAIARKSVATTFYTYDGLHATNGFHPLWQYFLGTSFKWLNITSHQAQATYAGWTSLLALAAGVAFGAAAIVRVTRSRFLGLLTVPGIYYLLIGAHYHNQAVWEIHDGMESGFAVLCGGLVLW
ncbi:MAG TPA: hypothetical protein P5572_21745, partial [Phycisphaerae bacterium]|nr:hypothetical protein [Phycisphaerae bacterium]